MTDNQITHADLPAHDHRTAIAGSTWCQDYQMVSAPKEWRGAVGVGGLFLP